MDSRSLPSSGSTTWYLEWVLLNIHLHCLVLDGVYRATGDVAVFHRVRNPTTEELQTLLGRIIKRIMKLLTRQGYLVEEQGELKPKIR